MLSACDSVELPHVFGGSEVPEAVLAQPRAVTKMPDQSAGQQGWPHLGAVPEKPTDFSSPLAIEAEKMLLRDMRDEAAPYRQENAQ